MKKTAIEKAIDAIEQDIAVLVAARTRLLAQQDKQPKRKKAKAITAPKLVDGTNG